MPEITIEEIKHALFQLKNGRVPGENQITKEMIELGGTATLESVNVVLNKCLESGTIPRVVPRVYAARIRE